MILIIFALLVTVGYQYDKIETLTAVPSQHQIVNDLSKDFEVKTDDRGIVIFLPGVLFDTGQYTLSDFGKGKVIGLGAYMSAPNIQTLLIYIEGHTDSQGSEEYNFNLAMKRAMEVKNIILLSGIDESRIKIASMGESVPRDTNETVEGRKRNRRVEIVIIGAK